MFDLYVMYPVVLLCCAAIAVINGVGLGYGQFREKRRRMGRAVKGGRKREWVTWAKEK